MQDPNIQNKSKPKNISPAGVLFLLLKIKRRLENRRDFCSVNLYSAITKETDTPATIIRTIQDIIFDNPTAAIETLGEDLFNMVALVENIPDYTWTDIQGAERRILYLGGRGSARLYFYFSRLKSLII